MKPLSDGVDGYFCSPNPGASLKRKIWGFAELIFRCILICCKKILEFHRKRNTQFNDIVLLLLLIPFLGMSHRPSRQYERCLSLSQNERDRSHRWSQNSSQNVVRSHSLRLVSSFHRARCCSLFYEVSPRELPTIFSYS